MPVQFKCDCSKEKFATALIAVGIDELNAMIDEDHGAEAVCQFCNNKYHYSEEELIELRDEAIRNTKQKVGGKTMWKIGDVEIPNRVVVVRWRVLVTPLFV